MPSARCNQQYKCALYSPRLFQNLYTVNKNGGKATLITEAGMSEARYNHDGSMIVFQDRKGYEDLLRKHHTSSVTRDIWTLDLKSMRFNQVSTFKGVKTSTSVFVPAPMRSASSLSKAAA
ncbi:MAG: hypothetical protein IPM92_17225 [Saprospiraceae bacterium]|nr:hypothetical protein [Saprospiraceae bacterium]